MEEQEQRTPFIVAGERVGDYLISKVIGEGGMGLVVLAANVHTQAEAAMKFLLPEVMANAEIKQRFIQEAKAPAKIKHDGIASVTTMGEHKGGLYLVMEFVDGRTLYDEVYKRRRGPLPLLQALRILALVADALHAAHEKGFVHRDIKLENIMLKWQGDWIKILDFGIAKLRDETTAAMTRTGGVMGTSYTMSPEQGRGLSSVDKRTDVYALACVAYALLSGRYPFPPPSTDGQEIGPGDIMAMHIKDVPPHLCQLNPSIPVELGDFLFRCLAKSPNDRPQTMIEFRDEIAEFADPSVALSYANPAHAGVVAASIHDGVEFRSARSASGSRASKSRTPSVHGEVIGKKGEPVRRRGVAFAVAGAVVVSAGIGALVLFGGMRSPPIPKPSASVPVDPPTKSMVRLSTQPPGALAVTADGHELGRTPVDVAGTAGEDLDVKLVLDGYATKVQTVRLKEGRSELTLVLDPNKAHSARPIEKPVVADVPKVLHNSGDSKRTAHKSSTAKMAEPHQKDELPTNLMGQ